MGLIGDCTAAKNRGLRYCEAALRSGPLTGVDEESKHRCSSAARCCYFFRKSLRQRCTSLPALPALPVGMGNFGQAFASTTQANVVVYRPPPDYCFIQSPNKLGGAVDLRAASCRVSWERPSARCGSLLVLVSSGGSLCRESGERSREVDTCF